MKKILFSLLIIIAMGLNSKAQIMSTSSTLGPGHFSLGIEPGIYATGGVDFNLFLHGGIGLTSNADLSMKLGLLGNAVYVGGDVEFALSKRFSIAAGAHNHGVFGLDFTALATLPLGPARLYSGLDSDLNFITNNDLQAALWVPLGLELPLKRQMIFYFETEINLTPAGSSFIGSGLSFLF
ncbi:MAG: hypothetical protein JW801_17065 [Bacteroidales bacterium]|nr:hypothetical protein [Bacteroidales bacterium]